jgi:DNA-directed RNA polymerase specialized sigma24 family protein
MAKRTPYVTNAEILNEFEKYWDEGIITNHLTELIYLIARKIANGRNFYGYAFKEDMVQEGTLHAINKGVPGFKKGKKNPFCYLSVIIQFKYIEYIKKEKRNIAIKEMVTEKLKGDILDDINKRK